ncbi:MAG TPA: winged helix DNA-binding domain-containing protein [Solirubrobacteraceae bacterium]|nr:winged helix DNA-binding domain-containing protein [Solirubrobacteraceae bacterium]
MLDDPARTRALRLRAQGLTGSPTGDVEGVCGRLVGIQAQELGFARLAFRPRCTGDVSASDVDAAVREGRLVWTWAMRGTLHLVRAADVAWLVGLLGPTFATRGRPRRLALGLDDAFCERALAVIRDVLATEGPQRRGTLAQRAGIDPRGQAPAHLLGLAAMRGLVRRVPAAAGRTPTFALLESEPTPLSEDEALTRLGGRYLAGHGPATAQDLAAWSGIGLRRARRALAAAAIPTPASPGDEGPHVTLLGHFDPYLLGYASRDLVLDPRHAKRIQAGGGFIAPAVLVDGRVVGTWRREEVDWLEPFEPLGAEVLAALERERVDVERFAGGS